MDKWEAEGTRFATRADLKKAGLLTDVSQSIFPCEFENHGLYLHSAQHVNVIVPTRHGRTTSIAQGDRQDG